MKILIARVIVTLRVKVPVIQNNSRKHNRKSKGKSKNSSNMNKNKQ